MIINVNEKYRIISTNHSWDIQEKRGGQWKNRAYYQNLDGAAKGLAQYMIREIEGSDLALIVARVDEVLATIAASMPGWSKAA